MSESTHELKLTGCAPIPLAHYLKALGILRLVAEQKDPKAQGWWQNDHFYLRSKLDREGLLKFFLEEYEPTPVVVPWSGNDFFAASDSPKSEDFTNRWPESSSKSHPKGETVIEAFLASNSNRLSDYRRAIQSVFAAMKASDVKSKDDLEPAKGNRKPAFIRALRGIADEKVVDWIDTATVLSDEEKVSFNALMGGGGGSDGNAHFSDNYMQCLWITLPDFDSQRQGSLPGMGGPFSPVASLCESLFADEHTGSSIKKLSPALFNSQAVGGANSTTGFDSDATSNPWDYILMFEGALMFAGASSRKLGSSTPRSAVFPFVFDVSLVGEGGLSQCDENPVAREMWLPIWNVLSGFNELNHLFSEARININSRLAKNGLDVARAIAALGIDRGISEFQRVALLRGRIGGDNYFTACDVGRFVAEAKPRNEELLAPLDHWLDRFRRAATGKNASGRAGRALRLIETAILKLCQRGDTEDVQALLIALGEAEATVAISKALREGDMGSGIKPVPKLSMQWVLNANDHSPEFRLAASLASIVHTKVGPFRRHLEPLDHASWKSPYSNWAGEDNDPSLVWGGGDLVRNMLKVLQRRMIDVVKSDKEKGQKELLAPLYGKLNASLGDISKFIAKELDDQRIESLLKGLILVDWTKITQEEWVALQGPDEPKPDAAYALLKLCHLSKPIRSDKFDGERIIKLDPQITRLAVANKVSEATRLASRRLLASGFKPAVQNVYLTGELAKRTAAALLFPIYDSATKKLLRSVTRQEKNTDDNDESKDSTTEVTPVTT